MKKASSLKVQGLGEFIVKYKGQVIYESDWRSRNALKLFKYLLINLGHISKDEILIDTFWPEYDYNRGKKRLYDTIYHLRKEFDDNINGLKESMIIKHSTGYRLNKDWEYWLDWQEFSRLYWKINYKIKNTEDTYTDEIASQIKKALKLYRGDFLSGDKYENWTEINREQYREMYLDLLFTISHFLYKNDKNTRALDYLRKGIRRDPYREDFYLFAMRILKYENRLTEAVKLYNKCFEILKSDLDISPSKELQEEFNDLKGNSSNISDDNIFKKIKSVENTNSAYICNKNTFMTVLEIEKRQIERSGTCSLILGILFEENFPEHFLNKLILNIAKILRRDDIITKWNNKKIYLLLNNTSFKNREVVSKRIKELNLWQSVDDMATFYWHEIGSKNRIKK